MRNTLTLFEMAGGVVGTTGSAPSGGGTPGDNISTLSFDESPNPGIDTEYARDDHAHGMPAETIVPSAGTNVSTLSFGATPSAGIDTEFARDDHSHGMPPAPSGGGGTPGGLDTEIQFNDGGSFGGISGTSYNKTFNVLTFGSTNVGYFNPSASSIGDIDSSKVIGLNDLEVRGVNASIVDYPIVIKIDGAGGTDTFRWSTDGGQSYAYSGGYAIPITGGWQNCVRDDIFFTGFQVKFAHTTGHTYNDEWDFTFSGDRRETFYDEGGIARVSFGTNQIGFFDYQGINVNSWIGKWKDSTWDRLLAFNITGVGTNSYRFHANSSLFTCLATDAVAALWKTYTYPLAIHNEYDSYRYPAFSFYKILSDTSGVQIALAIGGFASHTYSHMVFQPTSGNADFINLLLSPEINQTGSSSGNYTVLRISPYEQSLKGSANRLLSMGTRDGNDVYTEKSYFDNSGQLYQNGLETYACSESVSASGSFVLPAQSNSMRGSVQVGNLEEHADFLVDNVGTVTLVFNSSNIVANADTVGKFCIGTAGTQSPLVLKNNLAGTKNINLMLWYN